MKFVLCFWVLFYCISGYAQQNYTLKLSLAEDNSALLKSITYPNQVGDSLSVYREADQIIAQLQFKGYLLAEVESLNFNKKEVELVIRPNLQYQWVKLSAGNLPLAAQQSIGFKEKHYKHAN